MADGRVTRIAKGPKLFLQENDMTIDAVTTYMVTTTRGCPRDHTPLRFVGRVFVCPKCGDRWARGTVCSRVAVDTLPKACRHAYRQAVAHDPKGSSRTSTIPAWGGCVGPLIDGTLILVEPR